MITYIHEYKEPHGHKEEPSRGIERCQSPAVCHIKRQLSKHINDSTIHVTEEQKTAWTTAAEDKTSTEIEEEMTEVIDSKISEVDTKLDNYQLKSGMKDYATVDAVDTSVAELKAVDTEIKANIEKLATTDALNEAKEELTNADTEIKNTFSNYYTKKEADDKFSDGKDYSIKEFSITGNTITLDQTNGNKFKVTVPSSGSGEKGDKGDKGEDGATGISYSIDIIKNTLTKTTEADNTSHVTGDLQFYVIKTQDTTTYLTDSDANCTCYVGGKTTESVAAAYTSGVNAWIISLKDYVVTGLDPYILIRANTKTGSLIVSTVATFIIPGKDGESKGGQTLAGSVLRRRGDYATAKAAGKGSESYLFFDGTIKTVADGIMYQDIVTYDNGYYVCIDAVAGENDAWSSTPDQASYWEALTMSDDAFYNKLVVQKALVQELSSNEVVILDDDTIVAGMTSSKAIDDKSDLYNKITTKGDVRIWSGKLQSAGDLTSAPTTISSTGVVTSQNLTKGNSVYTNPTEASITISVPETVNEEYLPTSDTRKEAFSVKAYVDPDSLHTGARLQMLGNNNIILEPTSDGVVISEDYDTTTGISGSKVILDHNSIDLYNADGTTVFSATSQADQDPSSVKSVIIGESGKPQLQYCYNNGSMYLKFNNLATSDPHVAGALYMNSDGTLKVSLG